MESNDEIRPKWREQSIGAGLGGLLGAAIGSSPFHSVVLRHPEVPPKVLEMIKGSALKTRLGGGLAGLALGAHFGSAIGGGSADEKLGGAVGGALGMFGGTALSRDFAKQLAKKNKNLALFTLLGGALGGSTIGQGLGSFIGSKTGVGNYLGRELSEAIEEKNG